MKSKLLLLGLLTSMAFLGGRVKAQTYTYSPDMQTYTNCGSGTFTFSSFNYSMCDYTSGSTSYQQGHVKAAIWSRNASTGTLTFRVKKCSGYFVNGNTGKVIIMDGINGVYCSSFSITNSSTSYVTATISNYPDFNGSRNFYVFLITSDLTYKFYAGTITMTKTAESPESYCYNPINVTTNSATFKGWVNPHGSSTNYVFRYGTSSSNMNSLTPTATVAAGSSNVAVSANVTGLSAGTTYYYKIYATNSAGSSYSTNTVSFTTQSDGSAPTVTTLSPSTVNSTTMMLRGRVNPNALATTYYFQYGTTTSMSNQTTTGTLPGDNSNHTVTAEIAVSPNTTYYYRICASNSMGSDCGSSWSFLTESDNQPPTTPSNPSPSDGATNVSTSPTLTWTSTDPENGGIWHDFYLGTSASGLQLQGGGTGTSRALTGLNPNTTYYWKVLSYDNQSACTQGPVWHFTTGSGGGSGTTDCFSDCSSGNCGNYGTQMYAAAQYLCNFNIVEGENGNLNPDVNITRAQLAKVALYGLYNGSTNVPSPLVSDYFPSIYPDLQDSTSYYYRAAKALLYLEYQDENNTTQLDGVSPFDRDRATFNPSGYIERCLVLKVLMETFNIKPVTSGTSSFDDYGPSGYSSSQFWGYAQRAYNLGIVQTTHFRPNAYCTRGEAFLFLYRILTATNITRPTPVNSDSSAISDFFIPANLSPEVVNAMRGVEYGNFNYYNKDFFNIPGYMNLDFGVSYNSYLTEMPDDLYPVKPLGKAWSHTYNMYMNTVADNYNNRSIYVFHMQDGTLLIYADSSGTLTSLTEGNYYTLSPQTPSASSYTLTSTNQVTCTFTRQSVSDGIYYLTQIKDRNNNAINITLGSGISHYRTTSVSTQGRTLNFYYTSGTDQLSYVKDPINRKVYFYYNTGGQLTSLKDAKNQTTSFSYGTLSFEKGLLKEITLPKGNHVYNNYQQRKLTSMSRTSSTGSTFTDIALSANYQNGSSSSTVTENLDDGQSVTTSYTMNSKSRITRVTSGTHTDFSYQYNIAGKPDLISKATNNKTNVQATFTYNNKGQVTTQTVSAGGQTHTTEITYTALNDIYTITDANGNTTTYEYTPSGNLSSITDALGHTTSITNNSHGFPTQVTNPMGVSSHFTYNSYGNTTVVSVPSLSLSSSVSYDNVSRPTSSTDFANRTTTFTYDNNDNLQSTTDALNHTTSYTYDANDNLTQITNALGRSTNMTYDNNDFMTALSFQGATRSYTYNRDGTLATFTSPNGHTFNFDYNSNGELTSDGYATYSYNSKGQLSTVTKDGNSISYIYDAFGRVSSISYDGKTVSYTYDNNGNVLTMVYPGNKTVTYTYDAANRMTSVTDWNGHATTYTYRNDNQLSHVLYPNNVRTTYNYDNAGRRTGMTTTRNNGNGTVIAQYSYTLDNNGNHTQASVTEPYADYPAIPSQNTNYTYNNANRLMTAGALHFNYDDNGNTTSRSGRNYTYDVSNNLTGVSGDFSASYAYDGLGNRRSATRNGSTTKYVLNLLAGNPTVLMETSSSGTAQHYYIYGADSLVPRIGANGSTTHYYVYDYRGSTVAMTDATSSANITHKYQYDEFGKVLQSEETDNNPFRYVGKYGLMYEGEDLYFVRARYYDPSIGRFLSEDPVWNTNLYPYADNNPIIGIDPSGKWAEGLQLVIMNAEEAAWSLSKGLDQIPELGKAGIDIVKDLAIEWSVDYVKDSKKLNELLLQEAQLRAAKSNDFWDWVKVYGYETAIGFNDIWINDYTRTALLFCIYTSFGANGGGLETSSALSYGIKKSVKPLIKKKGKEELKKYIK